MRVSRDRSAMPLRVSVFERVRPLLCCMRWVCGLPEGLSRWQLSSGRTSCCVAGSSLGREAQTDPRTYGHGSPSPSTAF